MENLEKALIYFADQFNCSQSVFSAYSERFGISEDDAIRIATGFGAGFGREQEVCGAISGAVMVLGCKYFKENDVSGSKEIIYNKTNELLAKFKEVNNTIYCSDLTGIDFKKDVNREEFKKQNIQEKICKKCIVDVCKLLEEMI
jgi:C_GCAxxG_C_C family probable redox protein